MTKVHVFLHNETEQNLVLRSVERQDGDWLGWPAPQSIPPMSVLRTGTRAAIDFIPDVEVDGTECLLRYEGEVDAGTTFMVHWNNPAIGATPSVSPGGGIHVSKPVFATDADEGHYAFWQAEGRADATVHYFFRDAGEVWTDFRPSNDGFRFSNSGWMDPTPYALPPLHGTPLDVDFGNAANGLCGGMVFAALDYFLSEQRVPQDESNPPNTDPLFGCLVARLFDSFDPKSISLLYSLMCPAAADDDESLGEFVELPCRARVMAFVEWPLIRADIDAGKPSPIALQTVKSLLPTGLGECHQVLAYAYEAHGHSVTLHVYDPNSPGDDTVFMRFEDGDISHRIVVDHTVDVTDDSGGQAPIYSFIRMNYHRERPRIPTERRLTTSDIAHRHLSLVWGEPERTDSHEDGGGRRTYDIWPDCGTAELDYTVIRQTWRYGVEFTAYGFYEPVVEFRLGSTPIVLQSLTDYTVPGRQTYQPGPPRPGELGIGVKEERDARVRTDGGMSNPFHGTLAIYTRADDGNYVLPIKVICRESGEAAGAGNWKRKSPIVVEGWREDVPGLSEARTECFTTYLNAHRDGQHDVAKAAAEIELTLPGRPGNPLLDPDPAMLSVLEAIQALDPRVLETAQIVASLPELKADLLTQVQEQIRELAHPDITAVPHHGEGIDVVSGIQDALSGIEIERPT